MEIMQLKRTARLRCSKVQNETTRKKLRCNTKKGPTQKSATRKTCSSKKGAT